jgi:hypothetical protein
MLPFAAQSAGRHPAGAAVDRANTGAVVIEDLADPGRMPHYKASNRVKHLRPAGSFSGSADGY